MPADKSIDRNGLAEVVDVSEGVVKAALSDGSTVALVAKGFPPTIDLMNGDLVFADLALATAGPFVETTESEGRIEWRVLRSDGRRGQILKSDTPAELAARGTSASG